MATNTSPPSTTNVPNPVQKLVDDYVRQKTLDIMNEQIERAQEGLAKYQKDEINTQLALDAEEAQLAALGKKVGLMEAAGVVGPELEAWKNAEDQTLWRKMMLEKKLLEILEMMDQIVRFEQKLQLAVVAEEYQSNLEKSGHQMNC